MQSVVIMLKALHCQINPMDGLSNHMNYARKPMTIKRKITTPARMAWRLQILHVTVAIKFSLELCGKKVSAQLSDYKTLPDKVCLHYRGSCSAHLTDWRKSKDGRLFHFT